MSNNKFINWSPDYKIGHEKIDEEHMSLFEIGSSILMAKNDRDEIEKNVRKLIRYTRTHFFNEETYMKSIHYPKFEQHHDIHKQIMLNLDLFLNDLQTMSNEKIADSVVDFININIVNHIIVEDKKVHHFRRSREELKDIFEWKQSYKIGNSNIDYEHEKLFELAIKAVNLDGLDIKTKVRQTIIELYDYMKIHFENEEKYMEEINYPGIIDHKMAHKKIIDDMNKFLKELPSMKIEDFERRLVEYIDIWLVNHIVHEDKNIAEFSKTQNR